MKNSQEGGFYYERFEVWKRETERLNRLFNKSAYLWTK